MEDRIYINELKDHIGDEVTIAGWADSRRDHGKLMFLDLRDMTGLVQMVALPSHAEAYEAAQKVRDEWVLEIHGKVNKRPEKMINPELLTGDLEIEILDIKVLNESETPPIDVRSDGHEIGEEHRLKYRYLDLRRPRMQKNIGNRHRAIRFIREYLSQEGFTEIETPILTKSTPEGARDFIVPSRLEKGKFYALPQSPQQYKQLLMVAGFEKYFQIARCMRDEDTRGDRQAEFTQLDLEMSFVTQNDILELIEKMYTDLVRELYPGKHITQTPWPRLTYDAAMKEYNSDKPDIRKNKDDQDELGFVWVLDFPLFEAEMVNGHFAPSHHMFTMPKVEDIALLESNPEKVRSYQHDLALNGFEIAGGSLRIHDHKLQAKIFDLIGFSEKQKKYFDHMLTAFQYGVPPHGGIAPGLDRFLMILEGESSIREVMAFPKTGEGRELLMGSPSPIAQEQLIELGIKIS
ncbi:aspartate--tRNA ligase [bacterium]|nr:aspartate--tRNA ligase [bacterium]